MIFDIQDEIKKLVDIEVQENDYPKEIKPLINSIIEQTRERGVMPPGDLKNLLDRLGKFMED